MAGTLAYLSLTCGCAAQFQAETLEFAIEAQPLEQALTAFRQQSLAEIAYDASELKNTMARALYGHYDRRTALALMLRGTGYTARQLPGGFLTIVAELELPDQKQFFGSFQQALTQALCASHATRPGNYSTRVQVWFGTDGHITEVLPIETSGLADRDRAIQAQLMTSTFPSVYSDTAVSLIFSIKPTKPGRAPACSAFP